MQSYDVYVDNNCVQHCLNEQEANEVVDQVYQHKKRSLKNWNVLKNKNRNDINIIGYENNSKSKSYKTLAYCSIKKNQIE